MYIKKKDTNDVVVSLNNGDDVNSFCNMKNAVCWCVLDKIGKYNLADRVIDLDMHLSSVEVHISIHSKLFKKAKKTEDKLIYLAKLNQDKLQQKAVNRIKGAGKVTETTRTVTNTDGSNYTFDTTDKKVDNEVFTSEASITSAGIPFNGYKDSRYISKVITLEDGMEADDLKMYITANKPANLRMAQPRLFT